MQEDDGGIVFVVLIKYEVQPLELSIIYIHVRVNAIYAF